MAYARAPSKTAYVSRPAFVAWKCEKCGQLTYARILVDSYSSASYMVPGTGKAASERASAAAIDTLDQRTGNLVQDVNHRHQYVWVKDYGKCPACGAFQCWAQKPGFPGKMDWLLHGRQRKEQVEKMDDACRPVVYVRDVRDVSVFPQDDPRVQLLLKVVKESQAKR